MGDFPNFHGCDGYPHGLSMEYLRQAQRAFGRHLSDIDGHTAPDRLPPVFGCEDAYAPRRPQGHRFPGDAQFQTFLEHRFGRVRPSAQPLRHRPLGDRPARYTQPYLRPGVPGNINREPHRNLPIRPLRRHYHPVGVPCDHSFGQTAAVGQKSPPERTPHLGSEYFAKVRPANSTHAHSNPPVETWQHRPHMRPYDVLTPQGGPGATLFESDRQYSSTEPTAKPFRNTSPTQGHCSTINDDESEGQPEAWEEPNTNDRDSQDPETTDTWENIGTSSTHSSPPELWTPFSTSYSEQPQQQEDYFTFRPRPRTRPPPHPATFHDRPLPTPSPWPRHRRSSPRSNLQLLKSQLHHLQRASRQLNRERRHLSHEQGLLNQQRSALHAEKTRLQAQWRRLHQARPSPRPFWASRPDPHSHSSRSSSSESMHNRSSRTPPGTPDPFPPRASGSPNPAAALESYNRAWKTHLASPTRTPFPWPTTSLRPDALTQPVPRHVRRPDEAIPTADVVAYNTVAFFARAFGLRALYVLVGDEESGRGGWELGVAGLEGVGGEVVAGMRAQVKMEVLRWHEDKRGRRGGVEEGWARGVYAGVFAVKMAVDGEVKRRRGGGGYAQG